MIRSRNIRSIKSKNNRPRLSVFRSNKHIFAQIIDDNQAHTLVSCSTLDPEIRAIMPQHKNNCKVAWLIGQKLAERCLTKDISQIIFDRHLYSYKGRIKALAEGARAANLKF